MDVRPVLSRIKGLPHKDDGRIYITSLKPLLKEIGMNQTVALALWQNGDASARDVAVRIADPSLMDNILLEQWVNELDEWGLTDAFAGYIVKNTPFAVTKINDWINRDEEYVVRAAFATMAQMAWAKNDISDNVFISFFPLIEAKSNDSRFYVKKAINWALRDIGKRNSDLQKHAASLALKLQNAQNKTMQWVGTHRVKEFMVP